MSINKVFFLISLFCEKIVPESVSVISQVKSGEFTNVKVVGMNGYEVLVEQNLIHKKASAQSTQRPTRKETYMHPPLGLG